MVPWPRPTPEELTDKSCDTSLEQPICLGCRSAKRRLWEKCRKKGPDDDHEIKTGRRDEIGRTKYISRAGKETGPVAFAVRLC